MLKLTPWFCIAALLSLTIAECGAEKWPLHIAITGASPTHGEVIVALFDSEQRFLVEPISTITQSVDDNGQRRLLSKTHVALSHAFYDVRLHQFA